MVLRMKCGFSVGSSGSEGLSGSGSAGPNRFGMGSVTFRFARALPIAGEAGILSACTDMVRLVL